MSILCSILFSDNYRIIIRYLIIMYVIFMLFVSKIIMTYELKKVLILYILLGWVNIPAVSHVHAEDYTEPDLKEYVLFFWT